MIWLQGSNIVSYATYEAIQFLPFVEDAHNCSCKTIFSICCSISTTQLLVTNEVLIWSTSSKFSIVKFVELSWITPLGTTVTTTIDLIPTADWFFHMLIQMWRAYYMLRVSLDLKHHLPSLEAILNTLWWSTLLHHF